jgi:hypothetical protein
MERAQGRRISWEQLPSHVRQVVEERLGDRVVEAETQQGGFSPGVVARLRGAGGGRIFIKATHPERNPESLGIYREEARIAAGLPAAAPVSRLLWTYDEGDTGWVVLAFADVEGHLPKLPWRREDLERVVAAIADMHVALTPSPVTVPFVGDVMRRVLSGWSRLDRADPRLDSWARRHRDALAELEQDAPAAAAGDTLLHVDLRSDNILLTDDAVVIVDWPWAAIGASWVDMVGMAPSVVLEGGPEPEEFIAMHPVARAADPRRVDAVVAAIAGFFISQSLLPPPLGLPTLREFQAAQGEIARRWLAERTGLA